MLLGPVLFKYTSIFYLRVAFVMELKFITSNEIWWGFFGGV